MRVRLDPQKLAARNLTAMDVSAAVRSQNTDAALGRVGQPPAGRNRSFQFPLATLGSLSEPKQFENIILKTGPPRFPAVASTGRGSAASPAPTATTSSSPADLLPALLRRYRPPPRTRR